MGGIAYNSSPYYYSFEGVCLNSRHPDPRRVWKVGSEQHLLTPFCGECDENQARQENAEMLIFDNHSITLAQFARKALP